MNLTVHKFIPVVVAALGIVCVTPSESNACGWFDWLTGKNKDQVVSGYSPYYGVAGAACCNPCPQPCVPACQQPTCCAPQAACATGNCGTVASAPLTKCIQTAQYVPTTAYRLGVVNVPVTSYRPITQVDPYTGCATTGMQPVTKYVRRIGQVPYTTYKIVYSNRYKRLASAPLSGCATGNCGAVSAQPTQQPYYRSVPTPAAGSTDPHIGTPTPVPSINTPATSLRSARPSIESATAPQVDPVEAKKVQSPSDTEVKNHATGNPEVIEDDSFRLKLIDPKARTTSNFHRKTLNWTSVEEAPEVQVARIQPNSQLIPAHLNRDNAVMRVGFPATKIAGNTEPRLLKDPNASKRIIVWKSVD